MLVKRLVKSKFPEKKLLNKTITRWRPLLLSRHPSHQILRTSLALQPFRSVIRLGSETIPENNSNRIQINIPQAIRNSACKLLMKRCFTRNNIKTAKWYTANRTDNFFLHTNNGQGQILSISIGISQLSFPIISKSLYGSRGNGNVKHDSRQKLERWIQSKDLSHYIFEEYFEPGRRIAEYRIHCTADRAFYSCRKMLKRDTPENLRYQRHSDNCVWVLESNTSFDKPENWENITQECIRALNSIGLDIGCFDVKVQAKKDQNNRIRQNPEFIIIESNSAPSLAEIGTNHYLEQIPLVLAKKYRNM